jgi:sarcosine oxidase subunit gamma
VLDVTADLPAHATLRLSPLHDRTGALATASGADRGIELAEVPFLASFVLRADPRGAAAHRIGELLGVALPSVAGTVATVGRRAVLWAGPDEWLVVGPDGDGPQLYALLAQGLGEERGAVVDVSANRTTIEVRGRNARDLLEKGCALDLHPRSFAAGRCAHTVSARTQVVLWQTSDAPVYRLLVRGSFAAYLADWLLDAAQEYDAGLAPAP